jgi:UDP-2,3-diacylglucosamine pyrophosphatase LpxH
LSTDETRYRAVVSDLHLGEGAALENFVQDGAFVTFLQELARRGSAAGGGAELILNGDIIDFLQIAPFQRGPWPRTADKLDATFRAHPAVFAELGRFVAQGHRLVLLVGNHDIELKFEPLQRKLIEHVASGSAASSSRIVFPNDAKLEAARFQGAATGPFVYRVDGVHIEHGNQLDPVNSFDFGQLVDAQQALSLPWGSRFVLSVFNEAAREYRYLDKVRSKAAAALLLWCLDPELARRLLPGFAALGGKLLSALKGFYLNRGAYAGTRAASGTNPDAAAFAVFGEWADELKGVLDHPELRPPAGARGDADLKLRLKLLRGVLAQNTIPESTHEADSYADAAFAIAEREQAHTVILGHTHGARDLKRADKRYLNTGTWIDRVELDRLKTALDAATDNHWEALSLLLDPASFPSSPLLSYVELVGGRAALCSWQAAP